MYSEIYTLIQEAIDTGATIEIVYSNYGGEQSIRKLSDVEYSEEYGNTHITAFCHKRHERRTFKIDRIERVTFLSGGYAEEDNSAQSAIITPMNQDIPYRFNPNKRIFNLYGEDYNY